MYTIRIEKLKKMVQEGKVELMSPLRIGTVEVWNHYITNPKARKSQTLNVVE